LNNPGEFDIGPLTWVKGEIDQALERSLGCLRVYAANPAESEQLKFCRTHFHQAHGALQIVGLDGVTRVSEELEGLLGDFEDSEDRPKAEAISAAEHAYEAISAYLGRLLAGEPNHPVRLFSVYRDLAVARGKETPDAVDLYYPDLTRRPPRREQAPLSLTGAALNQHYRDARARYQRGLLRLLKNDPTGAEDMRAAVAAVEAAQSVPAQRAFWWVALGFFDALVARAIADSPTLVRLCNRIEHQLKRLVEGSTNVAERLMREALFAVARARPATEHLREVQEVFNLAGSLPTNLETRIEGAPQAPGLRAMRELVGQAKTMWNKVASGHHPSVASFRNLAAALAARTVEVGHEQLRSLATDVAVTAKWLGDSAGRVDDAVAMEVATALLLVESAVDNFAQLGDEFTQQVTLMRSRLQGCMQGKVPEGAPPMLDEMSRRAQERLLMTQVVTEIQASLRTVEQALDGFFRDSSTRGELAALDKPVRQVLGALTMLNEDRAAAALATCAVEIQRFGSSDYAPEQADFERVAGTLSGIGFYVDALQHGNADFDAIMAPIGPRRSAVATKSEAEAPQAQGTIEAGLAKGRREAQELYEQWRQHPDDELVKGDLKTNLQAIQKDAGLVADAALERQAAQMVGMLEQPDAKPFDPRITQTLAQIAPVAAPEAAPSQKTQELVTASAEKIDAELLAVYLEEAGEVLAGIAERVGHLRAEPHAIEELRTIRRGFHTLKGSGRMVGLARLGEAAWAVEQVMNKWLEEERPATRELMTLLTEAEAFFSAAVAELKAEGTSPDESAIIALASKVKADESPGEAEAPIAAPPPVARESAAEPAPIVESPVLPQTAAVAMTLSPDAAPEIEVAASPDFTVSVPIVELPAMPASEELPLSTIERAMEHVGQQRAAELVEPISLDFSLPMATIGSQSADPPKLPEDASAPQANMDLVHAAPAAQVPEETVRIGDAELSRTLYEIFLTESQHHLAAMRDALRQTESGDAVTIDLRRATHTLAGIAGTVKLDAMWTLGHSFENMLHRAQGRTLSKREQQLAQEALGALEAMAAEAAARNAPRKVPDLVARLETSEESEIVPDVWSAPTGGVQEPLPGPTLDWGLEATADAAPGKVREAAPGACSEPGADSAPNELVAGSDALIGIANASRDAETLDFTGALPQPEQPEAPTPEPAAPDAPARPSAMPALASARTTNVVSFPIAQEEIKQATSGTVTVEEIPIERRQRRLEDDIDRELLPIFLEEAQDLIPSIGQRLRDWRDHPNNRAAGDELQRHLHTLKGSARMCGAMALGELTHSMESKVENAIALKALPPTLFDELETAFDRMGLLFDRLQGPEAATRPERETPTTQAPAAPVETIVPRAAPAVPIAATSELQPAIPAAKEAEAAAQGHAMLRVRADVIDRLINEAGEVSIARSRIEGELRALKGSLSELTENVNRLRAQLREIEIQAETQMQSRLSIVQDREEAFDPLEFDRFTRFQEITRMMAESVNDVATVQQNVLRAVGDADGALSAQSRLTRNLQQDLMRIRMVPFASVAERLYRVVRQAAKETEKRAVLDIRGGQVELDRSVLERITAPFEHMLRNSVAHGIEPTATRIERGKPELGEIKIEVRQEGNEVMLAVSDDGGGINLPRVLEKARSLGLVHADQQLSDSEIAKFIFDPGFSTASEVSQLAGRGVGMDVVKSEVAALGGRIETHTEAGKGTRFLIYLPLTLAVTQAVLVRAGQTKYAIPAVMVEQVRQVKAPELAECTESGEASWQNRRYPFRYLPRTLGDFDSQPENKRFHSIMFVRSGAQVVAIHVDEVVGNQEIVVKNTGPLLSRIAGITGATVLGSGEIVLILNPVILAGRGPIAASGVAAPAKEEFAITVPSVMIVDDSLTVRKITGRLLAREGYHVLTAKDGVDAVEQLQDHLPDVMLVDIEMPRMDGFDLTRAVRGDPRLKHIPIIMITSRTAEKHRAYAKEIGVNVYLGKPFQEDELLGHIAGFVGKPALVSEA
jgi:chemosensory pili system protein ChpA (sensor histidine kinase/response regulator)